MQLRSKRVLVTGATGGIGRAVVRELMILGAQVGLVGRDCETTESLAAGHRHMGGKAVGITADLTYPADREAAVTRMRQAYGGIDVLINAAGTVEFTDFADQDAEAIERLVQTNVLAPMQLTRLVLPEMIERGEGRIVNIGSIFGSIGFACFASYSASKAALRGFSEALRRELADSGVGVTYVAPRAVNTPFNSPEVCRMAERIKMKMDEPAQVARRIVDAVEQDRKDVYLGFPESLFVRINAVLPRLVDLALRKQNRVMRAFTQAGAERPPEPGDAPT